MSVENAKKKIYEKHQSFDSFVSQMNTDVEVQKERAVKVLTESLPAEQDTYRKGILTAALEDLRKFAEDSPEFRITTPIADELSRMDDGHIPRYIFHRYRYDVFPRYQKLDAYPPYLQIEPASVCNYRCVFCYQTDKEFTAKSSGHMGTMSFDLFKEIIDQSEKNVEFFSLASRGEPLICRDIGEMLAYCQGKFLGMKMNTNASLLTEKRCHDILSGGINTLVFSADAAQEPLYSKLRVGGKLDKVLKNIEMFKTIKEKQYPDSRLITRVSGVKFDDKQSMESMTHVWGPLVDQICFVDYNPWENVYVSSLSGVDKPCSDLWRRMFIWYDGKTNPCDTDYKSVLAVGSHKNMTISELWKSEAYQKLRSAHVGGSREKVEPCRRCTVV